MIKKIEEINKLGIFENYKWKCSKQFNRYNICFGFNGSGKSILSNLFNLISTNDNFSQEKKDELFEDLKTTESQSPGLVDFINEIIDFDSLPEKTIGNISKTTIKNKLYNLNKICDGQSHGNMQQLDECNFISNETLKEIATDTLDIIEFFDTMHKNGIDEILIPTVAEAAEYNI